jgi:alanine dehydrogenase|tara:strand:+ start:24984 stop:26072 length:1089 start_codon:yes stop_codon:yes gene_type:complete
MIIGVPSEVKNNEFRVGLTPDSVQVIVSHGHTVFVQAEAGLSIGYTNDLYIKAGATILQSAAQIYSEAELIIKVKEPIESEYQYLRNDLTLFTYLHLAGDPEKAKKLISTGVRAIAYETVTSADGSMPLLAPMSAIAGQISIVVGSYHLLKHNSGKGVLIGSFGDISPRVVTVIGGGVAGTEAITKATENNAFVKVIDLSQNKLDELKLQFGNENMEYILSSPENIKDAISVSDLVIGAVYVVGKEAPKIVTLEMLKNMKPGTVMVDISIDQGGCFESSRPTTHDNPTFLVDEVLHYCVTNMPGAVPLTATQALNKVTLPYILELANQGIDAALSQNIHLRNGLNTQNGEVTHPGVSEALNK